MKLLKSLHPNVHVHVQTPVSVYLPVHVHVPVLVPLTLHVPYVYMYRTLAGPGYMDVDVKMYRFKK